MKVIPYIFISALLIPLLASALQAEPALEQLPLSAPVAGAALPEPVSEPADFTRLSAGEAAKKLPLFDYLPSDVLSVTLGEAEAHKKHSVQTVEFLVNDPLRQMGQFRQKYVVYWSKMPGPRPTVLISPPFIPQKIDHLSARHFAEKGYNAVIIEPCESLTDTGRPLDKLDDLLIRHTIMMRMCIDFLQARPEVDGGRIYAYGISMGGIRTALIFGVDRRVKKAMEIVGGGDLPGIIADTKFKLLKELRDTRMRVEGIPTIEAFRAYLKKTMIVDPLDFGALRDPEDIFLVIGNGDRYVLDPYQEKLFSAFSRPEAGRYPEAKRSIVGHLPTAAKFQRYINLFVRFVER